MYICPMHPEITSDKMGKCPKCGMDLVKAEKINKKPSAFKSYIPLIVVLGLILLTSFAISVYKINLGTFEIKDFINYFMIGFFITFSGFKLMDLKGFVEGYKTYDLLAKRLPFYGYLYPFIELFFGLSMIIYPYNSTILVLEIIVMGFSGIGVLQKLLKKERFQCVCLGTLLKVPLTKVTLIEDFGMVALGLILLKLS